MNFCKPVLLSENEIKIETDIDLESFTMQKQASDQNFTSGSKIRNVYEGSKEIKSPNLLDPKSTRLEIKTSKKYETLESTPSENKLQQTHKVFQVPKLHSCHICNKKYVLKDSLMLHMRNHTGKNLFKCSACHHEFAYKDCLIKHMKKIHSEPILKTHSCEICLNKYKTKAGLRRHMRNHTGENAVKCSKCHKEFTRKDFLIEHMRSHVKIKSKETSTLSSGGISDGSASEAESSVDDKNLHGNNEVHSCLICNEKFTLKTLLEKHLQNHTRKKWLKCSHCHKEFTRRYLLVNHMKVHENTDVKKYSCEICDIKYTEQNLLESHIQTHTRETLFICSECHKKFTKRDHLISHMKLHTKLKSQKISAANSETTPKNIDDINSIVTSNQSEISQNLKFQDIVDVESSESENLTDQESEDISSSESFQSTTRTIENNSKRIMISNKSEINEPAVVESDELDQENERYLSKPIKLFECEYCDRQCTHLRDLLRHRRRHTGERPHECPKCSKRFFRKSHLKAHSQTHEQNRKWDNQEIWSQNSDKTDMESEVPLYECDQCDKKYRRKHLYEAHMKIISGETVFECSECHKKFSRKTCLQQHRQTHTKKRQKKTPENFKQRIRHKQGNSIYGAKAIYKNGFKGFDDATLMQTAIHYFQNFEFERNKLNIAGTSTTVICDNRFSEAVCKEEISLSD